MLKNFLFNLYLNHIICTDFVKEDNKLIEIKNRNIEKSKLMNFHNNIIKTYYLIKSKSLRCYCDIDQQNFEYQDLKFKDQKSNILFYMTNSYDNALQCILPYINEFNNLIKDYTIYNLSSSREKKTEIVEKFLIILTENSNISSENIENFKKIYNFDYLYLYSRYIIYLLSLYDKSLNFNDFFHKENIDDNIEIGFYKFSKFLKKANINFKNKFVNYYHFLTTSFIHNNLKIERTIEVQNVLNNNIELFLFSPSFILNYIYHKFVFEHFSEIYNFWKKKISNENINNYKEFELRNSYVLFDNDKIKFKINKKIIEINDNDNNETIQNKRIINLITLELLNKKNECIEMPLITKDNLKVLYKNDSNMLPLVLSIVDK